MLNYQRVGSDSVDDPSVTICDHLWPTNFLVLFGI